MSENSTQPHLEGVLRNFPYRKETALKQIFEAQKAFGSKFVPFDEVIRRNNQDKYDLRDEWINKFLLCIGSELGEILDWIPWKHWKRYDDFKVEEIEIRFELIDILHFAVSIALLTEVNPEEIPMDFGPAKFRTTEEKSIETQKWELSIYKDISEIYSDKTTELLDYTSYNGLYSSRLIGPDPIYPLKKKVESLFQKLYLAFALWDMTPEEVFNYYMSKNEENFARQERGY